MMNADGPRREVRESRIERSALAPLLAVEGLSDLANAVDQTIGYRKYSQTAPTNSANRIESQALAERPAYFLDFSCAISVVW